MHAGYNDIYGSRTYFADDPKMQQGAADLYNVRNGDVSQAMENIIETGQSIKTLHNKGKRPIPGVKGVDVTFKGGVRALREATINWTCWDFKELDFLMPHFLAHGKTVMVEWGWVYDKDTLKKLPDFVKTDEVGNKYLSADVYKNYRKQIFDADGDFDMMVGIIKNFEFTTREDGAFDCQTILTSVGASIMENTQANEVAIDPNITYNLSVNEDSKQTAAKIKKGVGEDGTESDEGGDKNSLIDVIEDDGQIEPDEPLMAESLKDEIRQSLDTLKDRERQVIKMYFGIDRDYALTLNEIGEEFNLTRERVRQIKEKAIRRLRHRSRSKTLRTYLG